MHESAGKSYLSKKIIVHAAATSTSCETLVAITKKTERKLFEMKILLDFDGVMILTPSWKKVELENDGFLKFDETSTKNLARIVNETRASIILTTTHRISHPIEKWIQIFNNRGIFPSSVSKINNAEKITDLKNRAIEIKDWVNAQSNLENYVVIDDDLSINSLHESIKKRCVITRSIIGLDHDATNKVLEILNS